MLYLAPSGIHGVGVYTSVAIHRSQTVPLFERGDYRFIARPTALEGRYCVETGRPGGGYWRPKDFYRMSIGYYLNHAAEPNVQSRHWRALRTIAAGEELTIDYDALVPVRTTPTGKRWRR